MALAHYHLELDDLENAHYYVGEALKRSRNSSVTLLTQAVIFWASSQSQEACYSLQKAIRSDRKVTNKRNLAYEEFWREKALSVLDELLQNQ